jgi:hypothetical protein
MSSKWASPVREIAERGSFRIEFAVNSDEIDHLAVGMPVNVKLDAFDYQNTARSTSLRRIRPSSTAGRERCTWSGRR